jgi:predicted MPP superfamily phosphohydrolase
MKHVKCSAFGPAILLLTSLLAAQPAPVGQWLFDDAANLTKADIGKDLVLSGTQSAIPGPSTGNGAVRIPKESHYTLTHGLGSGVNEYTLQFDIRVSQTATWHPFFQTNPANSDDADCFINTSGQIGIAAAGYTAAVIEPNEWYRVLISVKNGSRFDIYVDGVKALTGTAQPPGGRMTLAATLLLFADENGEDDQIDVAKVALYAAALDNTGAALLGGFHSSNGISAGPWLQAVSSTGITVMWECKTSAAGAVSYGTTVSYGAVAASTQTATAGSTFVHKARCTGLMAGTVYHYRVKSGADSTGDLVFRTAPSDRNSSFRFAVFGDTHYENPATRMFAFMVDSLKVDFAVSTGDAVSVNGDLYSDVKPNFVQHECRRVGARVPFFMAMGNHEVAMGNGGDEVRKFVDQPAEVNSDPNHFKGSYIAQYGGVALIALDWNRIGTDIPGWLRTQLRSDPVKNARFRFCFIHCSPFFERWHEAENPFITANYPPLLEANRVNATFSGHMHGYERGFRNGTYYCTNGGGSYLDGDYARDTNYSFITLGRWESKPPGFNYGKVNEFMTIDIRHDSAIARMHSFSSSGAYTGVLDSFVMIDTAYHVSISTRALPASAERCRIFRTPHTVRLGLPSSFQGEVSLHDIAGRIIWRKKPGPLENELSINTDALVPGFYVVTLVGAGLNITQALVIGP